MYQIFTIVIIFCVSNIISKIVYSNLSSIDPHNHYKQYEHSFSKSNLNISSNSDMDLVEIEIFNYNNIYKASIEVGTPAQNMNLFVDSQRNFISLVSTNCEMCLDISKFDENKSSTLRLKEKNYSIEMYKHELIGNLCNDVLRLKEIMINSDIVSVNNVTNRNVILYEGYLGLGFSKNQNDNLIYRMKLEGKIKKAVYSLFLRSMDQTSLLHIGGYSNKIINSTESEKIIYTNITYTSNTNFTNWFIPTTNVYVNDNLIDLNHRIILNSSSNVIMIPKNFLFSNLNKIFNKKTKCQIEMDNMFHCQCSSGDINELFPTFKFTLNNSQQSNITIPPNDYVMLENSGFSRADVSATCVLLLTPNYVDEYWVLGTLFMNDYYTIFDIENSRIGFYNISEFNYLDFPGVIMLSLIIICSSVVFFSILYFIYKKITNRHNNGGELLQNN